MIIQRGVCVFVATIAFVCLITILSSKENFDQVTMLGSSYPSVRRRPSFRREYPTSSTQDDPPTTGGVVLFSAPQKCGGRTIYELVEFISNMTHSHVKRSSIMNLDGQWPANLGAAMIVPNVVRDRIQASQPLEFVYTHFSYVPFQRNASSPSYVSIVRDPFERQRSFYYFKRYGDTMKATAESKEWRRRMEQKNLSKDSYDECVREGRLECVGERNKFELIRHFCGYETKCYESPESALEIAKKNIVKHYALVGVTEDFEGFLRVLQPLFPIHFKDALKFYNSTNFKRIVSTTRTKLKLPALNSTRNIMLPKLAYEYDLYYFIKERFQNLKENIRKHRTL